MDLFAYYSPLIKLFSAYFLPTSCHLHCPAAYSVPAYKASGRTSSNKCSETSSRDLLPMVPPIKYVYALALLAALAHGAPVGESTTDSVAREVLDLFVRSPTIARADPSETVPPASDDPNYPAYPPGTSGPTQPIRGDLGAPILGPQNAPIQQQNPDIVAPPTTDSGNVCVFKNVFLCFLDIC